MSRDSGWKRFGTFYDVTPLAWLAFCWRSLEGQNDLDNIYRVSTTVDLAPRTIDLERGEAGKIVRSLYDRFAVQRDLAAINIAPAFGILLRCHTRFIDAFDRSLKKFRPGYRLLQSTLVCLWGAQTAGRDEGGR